MLERKKLLLKALSLMIFTILIGMGATAAFFSDVIDRKMLVRSGGISFALPDGSINLSGKDMDIKAELNELDSKLDPIKKGDVFNYSFSTKYDGTVDAYIVPKLTVQLKNIKSGDKINVYRKSSTGEALIGAIEFTGQNQKAESFFLSPELVRSGDIKKYDFVFRVEEICTVPDMPPLMLYPEIDFAITQKIGNEWIDNSTTGNEQAFNEILNGNKGSSSQINGFTEVIGGDNTVNQDGKETAHKQMYFVKLKPVITEAEGDISEIVYYKTSGGKDQVLASGSKAELWLCMNSSNIDTCIRYSVKNKAGRIFSPEFGFEENNGRLVCFKK